jgi:peptidyl-prolyl cis-trans isomerase B (cyclophilin B)
MSQTRRLRRESAREQAQQRQRRLLAHRRKPRRLPIWRRLPSVFWQRKTLAVIVSIAFAAVIAIPIFASGAINPATPTPVPTLDTTPTPEPTPVQAKRYDAGPPMRLEPVKYEAAINTSKGNIKAELFPDDAPAEVNNFVFLSRDQFYIAKTMVAKTEPGTLVEMGAQTADPSANPGYVVPFDRGARPVRLGSLVAVDHGGGMGSLFGIVLSDAPDPARFGPVFGRVTEGLDVARRLAPNDSISNVTVIQTDLPTP